MTEQNLAQPAPGGQQGFAGGSPPTQTPAEQTARFMSLLFEGLNRGHVEFRYFSTGPKPKVNDRSTYLPLPLDFKAVEEQVLARREQHMICFGPAPRYRVPSLGEGKDRDCLAPRVIWADLDDKDARGGRLEILERIKALPLRPSAVVSSGYGRHVYYAFHSPLASDDEHLEWQRLIKLLRDVLRGDPAVTNISRVLRLPGSFNTKEGSPVLCEVVSEWSSWRRYSIAEVSEALAEAHKRLPVPEPSSSPTPSQEKSFDSADLIRRGVPRAVRDSIVTGNRTIRTGKRAGSSTDESGRDFWIAMSLMERGFSRIEIEAIFKANPQGCGSKWSQKGHGDRYLKLTLDNAETRLAEKKAGKVEDEDDGEGSPADHAMPDLYSLGTDGSIWFTPLPGDGDRKPPTPVKVTNSLIRIEEIHENVDTGQISLVIGFDYLGRRRRTTILRSQMADTRQLVAALAGEGAPVSSTNVRQVLAYLVAYEHAFSERLPRKTVTGKLGYGRSQGAFFLPGLPGDIEFAPSGPGDAALYRAFASRSGSLDGWVAAMRFLEGDGYVLPRAAVMASFVPPLQARLGIPNFIFDINGNTSTGKSTTLKLAASAWGNPDDKAHDSLLLQWSNTKVALEQIASICSDLPVFLDDAQHCPDEVKRSTIYLLANGRGKGRGARGGGIRETATWRTVALSTSEEPLHESSPHEGARGRLLPVGGLEPPFPPNKASLVQGLEAEVVKHHGHAGARYIRHLNGFSDQEWQHWQQRYATIRSDLVRSSSSDIVGRVAAYIAAIEVAAEIVCDLLGLDFKPEAIKNWLALHLNEQQQQQNQVFAALRLLGDHFISNPLLFASAGESLLAEQRRDLQGAVRRGEYVGYTRSVIDRLFGLRKWNSTAVLNKMTEAGALSGADKDRLTKKVSVDGVQIRLVCVKWAALFPDDEKE